MKRRPGPVRTNVSDSAPGRFVFGVTRRTAGACASALAAVSAALDPHVTSGCIVGAVEDHWTVGRVAELAGVSVRTLHHYDEIGLVPPSARTAAGYRAYSAGDVERLREVLAYRRLGFGLREVAELVGDSSTDAVAHLRQLRGLLSERRDRADAMVAAIDRELEARAKGLKVTPEEQLEMLGAQLYDAIGGAYTATRRTEPRIAAQVLDALGDAQTVLNVGAPGRRGRRPGSPAVEPAGDPGLGDECALPAAEDGCADGWRGGARSRRRGEGRHERGRVTRCSEALGPGRGGKAEVPFGRAVPTGPRRMSCDRVVDPVWPAGSGSESRRWSFDAQ